MLQLPHNLYTCAQTRSIDQAAIQQGGIRGIVLMKRAARAALRVLVERWPAHGPIALLCGSGNNAGDGYLLAGLAKSQGLSVAVWHAQDPALLQGDAQLAYAFACQEQVVMAPFDNQQPPQLPADAVVVDALLGTGVVGPVRPAFATVIGWINCCGLPVLALDLPSGLCGDTGAELGSAVIATASVCFVALKQGLLTARGPALCGDLYCENLDIPANFYPAPAVQRIDLMSQITHLPKRSADAHKGQSGHVLVLGGDQGFGGAALMAAEAALVTGAGLVSLATQPEHVLASLVRRPEVMALGVRNGAEAAPALARASVLAIGPGLGRGPWGQQLLQAALTFQLPMVVDADALNLLAEQPAPRATRANWILTPHPAEAGRLLGVTTAQIQADRFAAVRALQAKFGGVVLLKGAGTLIADAAGAVLANVGNAGLATAGSGDMLTGIIAGLLAQGMAPSAAARLGVCLHGGAAELFAEQEGLRGLIATDLLPALKVLMND